MSDCLDESIFEKLYAGVLDEAADARAHEHLAICPACRHEFNQFIERHRIGGRGNTAALREQLAALEIDVGDRIGPYVLRERIGEGGFGVVYLASQSTPVQRDVAIKIIQPGMATPNVVARFEAERQVLALLNHPHIADVYDAGVTRDGRPYFVMEYVAGIDITAHCDRNRLGIEERLALFAEVCDAVHHAHQKGIIHRDLKPSNILVSFQDGTATPKIIDFGVAKAIDRQLTTRTLFTERGQIIGTPEYMPPEQADRTGQDIDTRSDIYSLGVVLYELLTGALPFDAESLKQAALEELIRIIMQVDPPKPSTKLSTLIEPDSAENARKRRVGPSDLARRLRGDLDWITMKCLEKNRERRYSSAVELAADIRRHLNHEPVLAGPPGMAYRAQKFVRRNFGTVVATSAVLAALTVGGGMATYGLASARITEQELNRKKSIDQLAQAKIEIYSDADSALKLLKSAISNDPENIEARLELAYSWKRWGRPEAALAAAEAVLREEDDNPAAQYLLAHLLTASRPGSEAAGNFDGLPRLSRYRALALDLSDKEELSAALAFLEEAVFQSPWDFDLKCLLIHCLDTQHPRDYARMYSVADELTRSHPQYAITWQYRGAALLGLMDPKSAIADLDRAIELNVDMTESYYNRALAYLLSNQAEMAVADAETLVTLRDDPHDKLLLADAYRAAHDLVNARVTLDSLSEKDVERRGLHLEHARRLRILHASTLALWHYGQVVELERIDAVPADLRREIAWMSLHAGQAQTARTHYDWIREHGEPSLADHYYGALTDLALGRYAEAQATLRELDVGFPYEPDIAGTLALAMHCTTLAGPPSQPEHVRTRHTENALATLAKLHDAQRGSSVTLEWFLLEWEIHSLAGDRQSAQAALLRIPPLLYPWDNYLLNIARGVVDDVAVAAELTGRTSDQRCAAHYYMGIRSLIAGDAESAYRHFESSVATNAGGCFQYCLARRYLDPK